jgi:signal transduction histidine kinase
VTVLFPDPDGVPPRWSRLANGLTLAGLGLLVFGSISGIPGNDSTGQRVAALLLLLAASLAWLAWVLGRNSSPEAVVATSLVVVAAAGGALAAFSPIALIFPGIATLAAASRWNVGPAAAVGGAGALATVVTTAANGNRVAVVWGALATVFTGLMVGITRRQAIEHAEQATRLELASDRANVERTRAELLAERNRLARELHDVLSHTLAALSLQLEAFATVVGAEPGTSPRVRDQLERTRQLVREGLDEARGAVHALRDDAVPLEERLAKLAEQNGAAFATAGPPRPLAPEIVLALYRVAQEALTNVMKHATGAVASMELAFDDAAVRLTVDNDLPSTNGAGTDALGHSGGGFGLRGISERVALLGGEMDAGPVPGGWRVRAVVPVAGAASTTPAPAHDPLAS